MASTVRSPSQRCRISAALGLSVVVGAALSEDGHEAMERVYLRADEALSAAKDEARGLSGRNGHCSFDPGNGAA